jgi:hypothetical protein
MKSLQSVHGCFVGLTYASALALCALGCSAGGGSDESTGGGNTQSNGSSTENGNGGSGAGFAVGTGGTMAAGMGGGCAGVSKTADKVPLDMYIMLDQSGSMSDANKWGNVTNAIKSFIAAPEASGIGVGIQYFPLSSSMQNMCSMLQQCTNDAACGMCGPCVGAFPPVLPGFCQGGLNGDDSCVVADYAMPDVAIAPLPGNGTAITNSLNAHSPTGGTPTLPALDGAIQHAKAHATANPDHAVIVVLASDGDPNSCSSDLAAINMVASAGANGNPKILTFVIGVGNVAALDGIAAAGGTGMAYIVDQANAQQQFLMALNDIQGKTLPCSYGIPDPPMGEMLNLGQVNVTYTPSGGTPTLIPKVDGPAQCPPGEDAWYFDNNTAPQLVVLCPDTCAKLKADAGTEVEVVFGCDTVVK